MSSGSDHIKSHMAPSCGTSCLRSITRIWSSELIDGERPPCTQKILSSMIDESELRVPGRWL